MRHRLRLTRILTLIAAIVAAVVAVVAWDSARTIRGLDSDLREIDIHGQVAELESAFAGFVSDLTRFAEGDALIGQADISRRVDALWTRAAVLMAEPYAPRVAEIDRDIGALTLLQARLRTHEARLLDLDRTQQDQNRRLIEVFDLLRDDLRKLSSSALAERQKWRAEAVANAQTTRRDLYLVVGVASVLVALMLGIFALQSVEHVRMRQSHHRLQRTARSSERTRARFLSMMSHELRTPMNGVLGLLQLLKQSRLSESQSRLVDQAERSGAEMTELLGDILEFADLQSDRLDIAREPFQPSSLAASISGLVSAAATRNRTQVNVRCLSGTPEWVLGDFSRLRQALSHLVGRFVGEDDVRRIDVALTHDQGHLICRFTVETHSGTRHLSKHAARDQQTLGWAISVGLIELMGGQIVDDRRDDEVAEFAVRVPARVVYPTRDYVRIEESSETSAILLQQVIEDAGLRLWSAAQPASLVAFVLIEVPTESETATVHRLRLAHHGARIIAVGQPMEPDLYDEICAGPVEHDALQAMLKPNGKSSSSPDSRPGRLHRRR